MILIPAKIIGHMDEENKMLPTIRAAAKRPRNQARSLVF